MPVCDRPGEPDCAHEASTALKDLNIVSQKDLKKIGFSCSECGMPIRANEMGDWAAKKYPKADKRDDKSSYLVHQLRDKPFQGHVFVVHKGSNYGNGNYNWPETNTKGGKITTTNYKIK